VYGIEDMPVPPITPLPHEPEAPAIDSSKEHQ
jgi:hypothetical protein